VPSFTWPSLDPFLAQVNDEARLMEIESGAVSNITVTGDKAYA
jgi:hypothetical protein